MRLDVAPGEAERFEQLLVLGRFEPRFEGHSPEAAQPRLRLAGVDQHPREAAATPIGRDRDASDVQLVAIAEPQRSRDELACLQDAKSTAPGNLARDGFARLA